MKDLRASNQQGRMKEKKRFKIWKVIYRLEKYDFSHWEKSVQVCLLNCEESNLNKILFKIFSYIPYTNRFA